MSLSSPNLHYLFHREYFEGLDLIIEARKGETEEHLRDRKKETEERLRERTEELLSVPIRLSSPFPELDDRMGEVKRISLFSAYPGLAMGLGYPHDAKIVGAVKLGFSFDYVSGVPYLPGSSLKGILRSCFRHQEMVSLFLPAGKFSLYELEKDLFCGEDVFLGAYPVAAEGPLLGLDFITPHPSRFEEPNPLPFLVIRPNTKLEFCFILRDSLLSASEKEALYKALLMETGVGAKTNVGYGKLTDEKTKENKPGFKNELLRLIPERENIQAATWVDDGAILGSCPRCGANVVRSGEQVVCEASCGMRFRKVCGAEVGDAELSRLLHGGSIVIPNVKDVDTNRERPARISLCREGQSFCPDGKNGEKKGMYRPKYFREWLN